MKKLKVANNNTKHYTLQGLKRLFKKSQQINLYIYCLNRFAGVTQKKIAEAIGYSETGISTIILRYEKKLLREGVNIKS